MTRPQLYACLSFADVDASMKFLRVLGFTERVVYRDENDASIVAHAEFGWRDSGGVMFGSARPDNPFSRPIGQGLCYCVVATDDEVDLIYASALSAGGTSIREPTSPSYGGRECGIADPEGNLWSFGSYPGSS